MTLLTVNSNEIMIRAIVVKLKFLLDDVRRIATVEPSAASLFHNTGNEMTVSTG
jgi:hypothetical protein